MYHLYSTHKIDNQLKIIHTQDLVRQFLEQAKSNTTISTQKTDEIPIKQTGILMNNKRNLAAVC